LSSLVIGLDQTVMRTGLPRYKLSKFTCGSPCLEAWNTNFGLVKYLEGNLYSPPLRMMREEMH